MQKPIAAVAKATAKDGQERTRMPWRFLSIAPVVFVWSHRCGGDEPPEIEMPIDKKFGHDAKGGVPRLIASTWMRGEPFAYECSRCGQRFLFPEDRSPKDGVAELWSAFREHVDEEHGAGAEWIKGSGNDASGKT